MPILEHQQRTSIRGAAVICVAALLLSACGADGDDDGNIASSPTVSPSDSLRPTTTARPDADTELCTNPEVGYAVAYPAEWHTNDGAVAAACSYFDPEPIRLEQGTEPDTAISLYRTRQSYQQVLASFDQVLSRDGALIDGREAVAVTDRADGEGALPEATASYTWVVDLGRSALLGVTRQGPGRDYTRNTEVLDLIMGSLDLSADGADPTTIARIGAMPRYDVTAQVQDGKVCLRARSDGRTGAPTCLAATPPAAALTVAELVVPGGDPVVAGLADPDIARVLAGTARGGTAGFRPTDVAGVSSQAWVVPLDPDDLVTVIGYTSDRRMEVVLDGEGQRSTVLGDLTEVPVQKPRSSQVRRLTGVETELHAGYDRVTFRFQKGAPGFEASYTERPVRLDGSGDDVVIAGDAVLLIRLNQAAVSNRGSGAPTRGGPTRLTFPAGFAVTELAQISADEGVLTWVVGLRERLPFRLDARGSTVVLEVRHPGSDRRVSRTE